MNEKRKEYLSWDEYFMAVAILSSGRSKDPNTQVGACIVSPDHRILSIGYNGAPNGFNDDHFPWARQGENLETKYPYVVHAEENAILNYRGSRTDLVNSTIYVDLFPCNECAKSIVQAGIKEVVFLSDKYKDTEGNIASRRIFDECKVKYRKLELPTEININLSSTEKIKYKSFTKR
ncbi:MAG: dCMP deaminase family protein [Bacilli bacterium]|nr:dCMP deaminase family protein [Bacilli bacterium]